MFVFLRMLAFSVNRQRWASARTQQVLFECLQGAKRCILTRCNMVVIPNVNVIVLVCVCVYSVFSIHPTFFFYPAAPIGPEGDEILSSNRSC